MVGFFVLLTITVSVFQHTVSIPGLISRDLLPSTRINTQDISEGALERYYLLPVPGGLHSRRLLWFWGNDDDEHDVGTTTVPYNDGVTTTKRPSRWSRWKSKVGNAFKEFGNDIKEAANSTKWAIKKAGRKVKEGFKKGFKKIKLKIMSADDKLNHFANRLKAQAEKGNEKAIKLLQKLGIFATVEDGKVVKVDVEDEIDSVSNILEKEGILKVKTTTNLVTTTPYNIVTVDITQAIPTTDNANNNILSTSSKISTPVETMSNLRSTNLPHFSTAVQTTSTEISWSATEKAKFTTDTILYTTETPKTTIKLSTAKTTTVELPKTASETITSTTAKPKTTTKPKSTAEPKTTTKPKSTAKPKTTIKPTTTAKPLKTTMNISTVKGSTTKPQNPTTEKAKTTTQTPKTTEEKTKTTIKISTIEQPFKTDSSSILENANNDENEEVYSPAPFPDVFGDSRVKDRLMELYEKGDFTHSELADLFDPDYYEYYYDYE